MSPVKRRWQELASDYELATGLPCRVLLLSETEQTNCPICREFGERFGIDTSCSRIYLFSAYQSERWGGRYIYLCPLSGLYWSSPLMTDGMMAGGPE